MMSFETALRVSELLLAFAVFQRALEHLQGRDQVLFGAQICAVCILVLTPMRLEALWGLWILLIWQLHRFQGPYNGGSDKMTVLVVTCLACAHAAPNSMWAEMALAYLAVQLVLSYFVSGWVKMRNSEWRSGAALGDVFLFSAYPVSESIRDFAVRTGFVRVGSWGVIAFETAFPLALLHSGTLIVALCVTGAFHVANACLFGLTRFFWIWISAYPVLIWFQGRVIAG